MFIETSFTTAKKKKRRSKPSVYVIDEWINKTSLYLCDFFPPGEAHICIQLSIIWPSKEGSADTHYSMSESGGYNAKCNNTYIRLQKDKYHTIYFYEVPRIDLFIETERMVATGGLGRGGLRVIV